MEISSIHSLALALRSETFITRTVKLSQSSWTKCPGHLDTRKLDRNMSKHASRSLIWTESFQREIRINTTVLFINYRISFMKAGSTSSDTLEAVQSQQPTRIRRLITGICFIRARCTWVLPCKLSMEWSGIQARVLSWSSLLIAPTVTQIIQYFKRQHRPVLIDRQLTSTRMTRPLSMAYLTSMEQHWSATCPRIESARSVTKIAVLMTISNSLRWQSSLVCAATKMASLACGMDLIKMIRGSLSKGCIVTARF